MKTYNDWARRKGSSALLTFCLFLGIGIGTSSLAESSDPYWKLLCEKAKKKFYSAHFDQAEVLFQRCIEEVGNADTDNRQEEIAIAQKFLEESKKRSLEQEKERENQFEQSPQSP